MTTNWTGISPKPVLLVSPTGGGTPPNNGADFGPDSTLNGTGGTGGTGSKTSGIQEAINFLGTISGGTIHLLPGSFRLSINVDTFGVNNVRIELDPAAVIVIPGSGGWGFPANSITNPTRTPAILVRDSSNVVITGGLITTSGTITDTTITGIWVGPTVDNIHIVGVAFQRIPRFAILINGYAKPGSTGDSGPATNVFVRECEMTSCGNLTVGDGGGVRVENATSTGFAVAGIWIEDNAVIETNYFGVDVGGGSLIYTVNEIYVRNNLITGSTSTQPASNDGVKFEAQGPGATGSVIGGEISGNHIIGMGANGIEVGSPVQFVNITDNLIENSYFDGIQLAGGVANSNVPLQWILVSGNLCRYSNGVNNSSAPIYAEIAIRMTAGSSEQVQFIVIEGNVCVATSGNHFSYGLAIVVVSASGSSVNDVRICNNDFPTSNGSLTPIYENLVNSPTLTAVVIKDNSGYNPQPESPYSPSGGSFTTSSRNYPADVYLMQPSGGGSSITSIQFIPSSWRGGVTVTLSPSLPQQIHTEPGDKIKVVYTGSNPVVLEFPQ